MPKDPPRDLFGQPVARLSTCSVDQLSDFVHRFDASRLSGASPEVSMIWQNAIPRGKVLFFSAEGGAGKSALLVGLGVYRALGWPTFLGRTLTKGRTLYLSAEDSGADYDRKVLAWLQTPSLQSIPRDEALAAVEDGMIVFHPAGMDARFVLHGGGGYTIDGTVDNLAAWIARANLRGANIDLTVLETVSRFGADETNEGAATFITACERIVALTGVSILVVAHVGKAPWALKRDDAYMTRGASAFADNARGTMGLVELKARDRSDRAEIERRFGVTPEELAQNELVAFRVVRLSSGPADRKWTVLRKIITPFGIAFERYQSSAADREMAAAVSRGVEEEQRRKEIASLVAVVTELAGRGQPPTQGVLRGFLRRLDFPKAILPEVIEAAIKAGLLREERGPKGYTVYLPAAPTAEK